MANLVIEKKDRGIFRYLISVSSRFIIYGWLCFWLAVFSSDFLISVISSPYIYAAILLCVALLMSYSKRDVAVITALRHRKYLLIAYLFLVIIWVDLLIRWIGSITHAGNYETTTIVEPMMAIMSAPMGLVLFILRDHFNNFYSLSTDDAFIGAYFAWTLYFLVVVIQLPFLIKKISQYTEG